MTLKALNLILNWRLSTTAGGGWHQLRIVAGSQPAWRLATCRKLVSAILWLARRLALGVSLAYSAVADYSCQAFSDELKRKALKAYGIWQRQKHEKYQRQHAGVSAIMAKMKANGNNQRNNIS